MWLNRSHASADRRRVDDRQHLLDVVEQQPIEQHLVGVLEGAQVDVPLEVVVCSGRPGSCGRLLVQVLDPGRQQPVQTQSVPFVLGERRALVRQRIVQHPDPETLIDAHDLSRSFPVRPELRRCPRRGR